MIHARQIKAARALLDWSREDLAVATGLSTATIYNLEKGNISPRSATNNLIRQALEEAGLEFDATGIRLRDNKIVTIEGSNSCDVRASALLALIGSIKRDDFERIEKLGEITTIKCLMAELPKSLPATSSLQVRTAPKLHVGAVSHIEYGNKHSLVMIDGASNFSFKVFTSAGMARMYRENFFQAWELAMPILMQSSGKDLCMSA